MNRLALFLIKLYRLLPPLFSNQCIYTPSCSVYAQEAFQRYPFWRACGLTVRRLLRCHPFSRGGIDPVN